MENGEWSADGGCVTTLSAIQFMKIICYERRTEKKLSWKIELWRKLHVRDAVCVVAAAARVYRQMGFIWIFF